MSGFFEHWGFGEWFFTIWFICYFITFMKFCWKLEDTENYIAYSIFIGFLWPLIWGCYIWDYLFENPKRK